MIRKATKSDVVVLAEMAIQMWNSHTLQEMIEDFSEVVSDEDAVCFIKYEQDNPIGFAQCGLRHDYVEGASTSPVGYLEGIFVKKEFRNKGIAKELLAACEVWAKGKECTEFASDCELDNTDSLKFHMAMGFVEENRIICFKKEI